MNVTWLADFMVVPYSELTNWKEKSHVLYLLSKTRHNRVWKESQPVDVLWTREQEQAGVTWGKENEIGSDIVWTLEERAGRPWILGTKIQSHIKNPGHWVKHSRKVDIGGEADIGLEGFQQLLAETADHNNTVQHQLWRWLENRWEILVQ